MTVSDLSDRTLNALLDHLRDYYLATILAKLADRLEPYENRITTLHNMQ